MDKFGPMSGGMLLHFPEKTSRAGVCSISASWFPGDVTSNFVVDEVAWSFTDSSKLLNIVRFDLNAFNVEAHSYRRLITIHESWIHDLTSLTPCDDCSNQCKRLIILEGPFSDVGLITVFNDMRA